MTRGANRKTQGPGRRLLEIGKDLLIAALVLVNLTLAIMCLPSKTLTQTKWLAGALRPFAGLFGLNEAELTYTAPATGSTIVGAAQPLIITLSTEAGRQSAQYDFAALDELYGQYGSLLAQALESAETPQACTRTEFYAALRGTGAAFCFPGAISPSVLGAWLNVRAPEGGAGTVVRARAGGGRRHAVSGGRAVLRGEDRPSGTEPDRPAGDGGAGRQLLRL